MEKLKKTIPSLVLSFVASFMLFIYEPIVLYATNSDDFWFDFPTILPHIFLSFFLTFSFFAALLIFTRKLNAEANYVILIIGFYLLFATYIQGNFLAGFLPPLDGSIIEWDKYSIATIISILVWLTLLVLFILLIRKFSIKTFLKASTGVSLAVFAMLAVSLLSTLFTSSIFEPHSSFVATSRNFNLVSKNKNFFIFLVDAVDASEFEKVNSKNSTYAETFKDFTFFKDTLGAYSLTRDSIPFIFSSTWNENQTTYRDYATSAYDNSTFFKALKSAGYRSNFYEPDLVWNNLNITNTFENFEPNPSINFLDYYREISRYLLFKYAPGPLKPTADIESLEFPAVIDDSYNWDLAFSQRNFTEKPLEYTDDKVFHFIHTEGGHVPFDYDANLNIITDGTYDDKLTATYTVIKSYLDRLRANDVYDDSVIIIMADHGLNPTDEPEVVGRQNPLFIVKGRDEHHNFEISDKPVSYADLNQAFLDLLNDTESTDLFSDLSHPRTRRYLLYYFCAENEMFEQETDAKAWQTDELKSTGKTYILDH